MTPAKRQLLGHAKAALKINPEPPDVLYVPHCLDDQNDRNLAKNIGRLKHHIRVLEISLRGVAAGRESDEE